MKTLTPGIILLAISLIGYISLQAFGIHATQFCDTSACAGESITWYMPGVIARLIIFTLFATGLLLTAKALLKKLFKK